MGKPNRFDLILANGTYWIDCAAMSPPREWQGEWVIKALQLRGWYRTPLLGKLLRNGWAKRNGAALDTIHQGARS